MAFEDWLVEGSIEAFKNNCKAIVFETRCGCGAVLPLIFEPGSSEYEDLTDSNLKVTLEITCHECERKQWIETRPEKVYFDGRKTA